MQTFSIYSKVRDELKDFFEKKIKIGGAVVDGKENGGYEFSQWETLQAIEYIDGSKFQSGDRDSEGQQKFYLNKASFRKEVASKNIDLDLKNFAFIPEEDQYEDGSILVRKRFRMWAKDNGLSDMLNESVDDFPKYGHIVAKRIGKEVELVPLMKLRVDQKAENLKDAKYVILEHSEMTLKDMEEMPDWDTSGLDMKWDDCITVYERYGYVPLSFYKNGKNESYTKEDEKKSVYCVTYVAFDKVKNGDGAILFMEETDCPFVERKYEGVKGRWLGRGEIEKQFENQAIANMVFNLRKKSLAWSAKVITQTQDDILINNLVKEVRDGDVLKVNTPGGVWRVDTTNHANADFNAVDQLVEQNADQRSFTFEVATGESMPSGTPFRLGAIVGQSVNAYYSKKREVLGLFWKEIIIEFMIPQFEKNNKEFIEALCSSEEGFETLRQHKMNRIKADAYINAILSGQEVEPGVIDLIVEAEMAKVPIDYYRMTSDEVKNLKYRFDIDVTGESIDIPQKIETYTTLYQTALQEGDMETAKYAKKKIMILAGEKMPNIPSLSQPTQGQPGQQSGAVGASQTQQVMAEQPGAQM
jgi:hypothetical protein